ncbi:unnamed protein product [Linum tenue]|uniref:Uncharacterized protein n=1 Tax=Linum tenue TaxID=586396 RepID=A0AAV0P077_9ROSI|nr:unnamed protein product [Linum tenue]
MVLKSRNKMAEQPLPHEENFLPGIIPKLTNKLMDSYKSGGGYGSNNTCKEFRYGGAYRA